MTATAQHGTGDEAFRRLGELAFSAGVAAAVQTAARLRVPDVLDEDPLPVERLAEKVGLDAHRLYRLLRTLTSYGVFAEPQPRHFAQTDVSVLLREDHPQSLRAIVLWVGSPWTWQSWPRLEDALRSGESVIPSVFGKDFYTYLKEDAPADEKVFAQAMTESSIRSSAAVAEALDLSTATTVVDIGGGQGHLLRTLLRHNPHLHGVLFDLETVVPGAYEELREGGELGSRTRILGGNCLESVPVEADVYLLKNLLDWPDDFSVAVLRNIRAAARPGARVVVVDSLVDAHPDEMTITTALDLFLLLNMGGQKHSRGEFEELYARAGIEVTGVTSAPGTLPRLHLVEGRIPAAG
ncbi:methyltransferase [Streptomyces sp. SAJ15]|uniref:methyltransferase n=1 Tax=Streptomyces sp. SAJ15 TaxID=2011095 RepID=UPI00118552DC|nr:methyltransferase [Streptomyces sp. SAJ15]TVL88156.1 methyltransferase [Streptomyces sp. SAJ15]